VTAREVAQLWYGQTREETVQTVLEVLAQDRRQRYFVPQEALREAFRLRRPEEALTNQLNALVGQILFLQVSPKSAKPVYCRELLPGAAVRVSLPKAEKDWRTRYPYSAIVDVLGPLPASVEEARIGSFLDELVKAARSIRTTLSQRQLAAACQPSASYTLRDLCGLLDLSSTDLASRLAVAKVVYDAPALFLLYASVLDGEDAEALYQISPDWNKTSVQPSPMEKVDQHAILQALGRHLGHPPDLYRCRINPETGATTLAFHFPAIAQVRYAAAIAAAAAESGVEMRLSEQPHQDMLARTATALLPAGLRPLRQASLYHDRTCVELECAGEAEPALIAAACTRFQEETGWHLIITCKNERADQHLPLSAPPPLPAPRARSGIWEMNEAVQYAQQRVASLPGYLRVRVESGTRTLLLRFAFPEAAQSRYQGVAEDIKAMTGWQVRFVGESNQQALEQLAEQVLPAGLVKVGTVSLYHDSHQVYLTCLGEATPAACLAAQASYKRETGWQLTILDVAGTLLSRPDAHPRMTQAQAMEYASSLLRGETSLFQIGADEKRKVLWLHFHFPTVASRRLAAQIRLLEEETGWGVQIRQHVHQRALLELAVSLLPQAVTVMGKQLLRKQEPPTLRLTCLGQISPQEVQALQERFREETDCSLDLIFAASPSARSDPDPHRLPEAQALSYLHAQMRAAGHASCRIEVDMVRGNILLRDQVPGVTTSQIRQWEEETGWHIEWASPAAAVCIPQGLFSLPIEVLAVSDDIIECLSARQITSVGQLLEQDEMTLCSIMRPGHLASVAQHIQQRRWLPVPQSPTSAEAGAHSLAQD
jgi:hypothetical protein